MAITLKCQSLTCQSELETQKKKRERKTRTEEQNRICISIQRTIQNGQIRKAFYSHVTNGFQSVLEHKTKNTFDPTCSLVGVKFK